MCVGGALANDFYKAEGLIVGHSLTSKSSVSQSLLSHPKLLLPSDVVVDGPDGRENVRPADVEEDEKILDAGEESIRKLGALAAKAKFIVWNGPLGNYELGFEEGTEKLALALAQSKAFSILGGGDTIAAIRTLGIDHKFSFVSTGGGAMLEYLIKGTLPGIEVLESAAVSGKKLVKA